MLIIHVPNGELELTKIKTDRRLPNYFDARMLIHH